MEKQKDANLKVAEFIIDWDRETGGIHHDTHCHVFPVASALYWRGVEVGMAGEYHPAMGIRDVSQDEEDTQRYYDDFSDWTDDEMICLSIALEILWDAATAREDAR